MSDEISVYRVPFSGVVQDDELKRIETDIAGLVAQKPGIKLAVDLSKTFHISSRALGLLVAFRKQIAPHNGRIVLFGANPAVAKVLEVTKIDTLFAVVADEPTALEKLKQRDNN